MNAIGNLVSRVAKSVGFGREQSSVYRWGGLASGWFGTGLADANVLTTENLLRQGTVWAGVNVIAGDLGQIPFRVERDAEDGPEDAPRHPVARLLRDGPNAWQTIDQWLEWTTSTAIIWGNAISRIRRDGAGNVIALEPIPPVYVNWDVQDGEPFYRLTAPDQQTTLPMADVVHVRTLNATGFWGLRLAEVAYNELSLVMHAKRHAVSVFEKGAFPGGFLRHTGKPSSEAIADLRQQFEARHSSANAGRIGVLTEGMTYEPTAVTPADAQLLETISHDAVLVGQVLGISPYFLGDLRHNATRANLEEESKQYYARTLRRRVLTLEKELQRKLLRSPQHRIVADPTDFLKGDLATQVDVASKAVGARLWTRNEGRDYIGSRAVPDGDVFENPAIDKARRGGEATTDQPS